jgi:DNA-binding transcriptional LysR family regulator
VRATLCSPNGDVLMQAVMRGLGIAYLPEFIVRDLLGAGKLVEILATYAMPGLGIYANLCRLTGQSTHSSASQDSIGLRQQKAGDN